MRTRGYWSPKVGHARHEWEDGLAFSEARGVLAVADGASSSFMAQGWARHLVRGFVASPPRTLDEEAFDAWVRPLAASWDEQPEDGAASSDSADDADDADDAPWYVAEAAVRGAFATFLGVQVVETPSSVSWRAFAVGDTCLLVLRDGSLHQSFPLDAADDFDTTPDLLSSVAFGSAHGAQHLRVATGSLAPGDIVVLATDGLAAWALGRGRDDPTVWRALAGLDGEHLGDVADRARARGEMVNDDVTLVRTEVATTR